MKKLSLVLLAIMLSVSVMAQQKIQLRSTNRAECVSSDMTSLRASFSFSTIEAQDYESERGTFSWLSLPNTVIGGNEGDPQIPVVNELIAVPFGANPRIEITSFSTTDYRLEDYGIHTLVPRQPSLRKDQRPEEVPFVYNANAYQTRGLRSAPQAVVSVEGTMRGIRLGKMTIEPVSYDPVNNTLRVFNDIEVTVHFDGADARATEDMLVKTYSPYFNGVYKQMFNGRSVRDAYSQHPDLYTTPVKMLVITTPTYANNATFQEWVTWKKQKGIYVDVYTTSQTGTTASAIQSFITTQYNQNHPTFLVIVGDSGDVPQSATGSASAKYTDLYYSSIDGDIFPDMYTSRMPVSSSNELTYLLTKTLQYEQYTMPDPSYLDETLLIAGWDSSWTSTVGKPTIQYANTYYYNSDHGITADVFLTTGSGQTTCYNYINQVGFVNYTAHGSQTGWADPSFSVSSVNNMTNTNKYFWAMGNCCLAADWGYSGTCFAEAMVRAQNKGAWGYIGSCPSTYWWEDYYFGVGATNVSNQMPTMAQTTLGVYDAMFDDADFNTLNAVPFFGNIAVVYAHANGYSSSSTATDTYYWEAYHTLGDGSVMPYHKNPSANHVNHASTLGIGVSEFQVSADAGSYVALSMNNEILGVNIVPSNGTVNVPITPVTTAGDVKIVVTRQQRQPYVATIQAVSLDGPFISVDGYTPTEAHVGDNTNLSITFKNVGTVATSGTTTVTLTPVDSDVTMVSGTQTQTFGSLASNATTTVSGFQFKINSGVADGTYVTIHYSAVNNGETYEGNLVFTANEAVLEYQNLTWNGGFTAGETLTLTAKFKNTGHYQATNAVARMSTTSSNYLSITNPTVNVGTIAVGQEVSCQFTVTIAANCPETAQIPVTFTMTADGGLTAQGNATLKNACNVYFDLVDSYGDGWNGASLVVSFDDGTPDQSLTIQSGGSSASYPVEIGNGTHVTLTWVSGSYDGECSFTVSYEGNLLIFEQTSRPSAGVLYEFDCNCAAASQTFMVNVSSSNTAQGTVSGGGEYSYGETCTVTATPLEGFYFMNWTKNGEVVSTDASYSFVVNSDVNLVANFTSGLNVTVTVDPANAGTVSGGGTYGYGATCTVTATPAEGYFFTGWTQNGEAVQSSASYSFTVYNDVNLVANFAEGNMIGDGGTTTDSYLPSYSLYNYSLTQQIYTADELGEAGNITSIAFFNGGSEKTRTYVFYLKATTKNTFSGSTDWVTVTDADKVFSGSVIMVAGDWTFINFDTPYPYDGSSNLVLVTDDNTGSWESGMACRVFNASSQSIRIYNDNTNYDPFAPTSYEGTVMSVKNQILLTKEAASSTDTYMVTISANPEEGGTVAFGNRNGRNELVFDFEDGTSQGWTTLKGNNGDSPNNWMHITEYTPRDYTSGHGHSSDGFMLSESYISAEDEGAGTPVHPDNYLVSPQIQLGGSINFWVTGGKEEYSAEHFALLVSTTGNTNINDFTQIQEWTIDVNASKTGNTRSFQNDIWYEYTVDLSAFSGLGYVAFHHFDCYDEWLLCLDDITITDETQSGGSTSISATFNSGESCTVTATPNSGYSFLNWTENGSEVSTDASFTFDVYRERNLVANFVEGNMIGDGSDATSVYLPSYNYFNYTLSQQIYTADEFGEAGVITGISFYNGGTEKTRTYDFYMVATDKTSFDSIRDWVAVTPGDRVFSGSVTMVANAWTNITFDTPFVHDGVSNVILVTDDNSGSWTGSPHMSCSVFDAPSQAIYTYNDNTNFDPSAPTSYSGTIVDVKNQIFFTKEEVPTEPVNITVSAEPEEGGTVEGGGVFDFGDICTVTATVNEGYYFIGWTENGQIITTDLEFSFTTVQDRDLVASFALGTLIGDGGTTTNSVLPSNSYYNYSLTQQIYTADELGSAGTINSIAFYNDGGEKTRVYDMYLVLTDKTAFDSITDWIPVTEADKVFSDTVVMASGVWTVFTFDTPFEYDGTSNLALIMDDNTTTYSQGMACRTYETEGTQAIRVYSDGTNYDPFAPSYDGTLLNEKNQIMLGIERADAGQTITLSAGTNWVSFNVEITLEDLQTALTDVLGTGSNVSITIQSQTQTCSLKRGMWTGSLSSLDLAYMYKVSVSADCEIMLEGMPVDPAQHPITIVNGDNWIAFPFSASMTLTDAFAGLAVNNDVVTGQVGSSKYTRGNWRGGLTELEPGSGYIYTSDATEDRVFTFPTGAK